MTSKIIDNDRLKLADELLKTIPHFDRVSIATGYWDLPGFQILESALSTYSSVRLLIGQEPLPPAYASKLDINNLAETFPEYHVSIELANVGNTEELRSSANAIKIWIEEGRLEVKVMRGRFLHAKAYIFGDYASSKAIGVIGSSNFTAAGLTKNLELNALEDDFQRVVFKPQSQEQPHGHLSWFDSLWESEGAEDWNGKFTKLIDASPLGDLMFSEYQMYIKALYEIYGDEIVEGVDTDGEIDEVLYSFQSRNAKLLIRKLQHNGVAILADSVGLGKTITAGAVIKKYIEDFDATRLYIVAPAALTQQWKAELAENFKLVSGFEVISLQDAQKIKEARELDKYAPVDLFVLDEAHNMRSGRGARYDDLLEWFSENPDSHVLMLTATPINNSLHDLKNQIQLGAKGRLDSFPVVYPKSSGVEVIDFYEAIERLNKEIKSAVTKGEAPDYQKLNDVMRQGLRHFMVRTTRHGIEQEFGGVHTKDGKLLRFPSSNNEPRSYSFAESTVSELTKIVKSHVESFEGLDVHDVSIDWLLDLTQRAEHPFDTLKKNSKHQKRKPTTAFEAVFQLMLLLGFAPYKYEVYRTSHYGKPLDQIKFNSKSSRARAKFVSQLSIHNMLRVTLLKRMESSQSALHASLMKYRERLISFERVLDAGKIARVKDLGSILDEIGDDDKYVSEIDWNKGVFDETIDANPSEFNIDALKIDIARDHKILNVLDELCMLLAEDDQKLVALVELLHELNSRDDCGRKVLVFSYFADTIDYLKSELSSKVDIQNFDVRAGFVSGASRGKVNEVAKRFSPKSKKSSTETLALGELDYLFATDVLSEGQNLQDCAVIVNYDLHWNPVRMIQRNGRINRLGSEFEKVHVFNMHPDQNLNSYLALVERLQLKIDQIKAAVGTDQSVLGEEANPMEFIDIYDPAKANGALERLDDDEQLLTEDEFVRDLRVFDANASADEKELISSIGLGKWGRLPDHTRAAGSQFDALSLIRIEGEVTRSGKSVRSHMFVGSGEKVDPVELFSALGAIRVNAERSERNRDSIALPREKISNRAILTTKANLKSATGYLRFTRTVNEALNGMKEVRPDLNLAKALINVADRQSKKKALKLIRAINLSLRESGNIPAEVEESVENFITKMAIESAEHDVSIENKFTAVIHFGR